MYDIYNMILYNNKKYTKTKMDKTSITTIKKKNYCKMLFQDLEGQTEKNICKILNLSHNLYDKKMYPICIAVFLALKNRPKST